MKRFLSLFVSCFFIFGHNSWAMADSPFTGVDVNIIYGFSGRNGASAYVAIGWQVWNPGDRYGFGWKASTSTVSDADLLALTPGGGNRTQNIGNDGSQGYGRWETNGFSVNYDTEYFFKVGIFDSSGNLIDTSSITIPAFSNPGSPSEGLASMPVFYPVGGINPYAVGGLFNEIPTPPTLVSPVFNEDKVKVDVRFANPKAIEAIQYSTDDGANWKNGKFKAKGYGSIYGDLEIDTQSNGSALVNGNSYTTKIRGKNGTLNGEISTTSCFTFVSTSITSCSSGGGGSSPGGGGSPGSIPASTNLSTLGDTFVLSNPLKVKDSYFKSLTSSQIGSISVSQFAKLSVKTLGLLSASQAINLSFDQLKALKPSQVVALKPAVIAALNSTQITALQPADFRLMKTTQISRISGEAAAGLAKSDLNSFSRTQLRSLNSQAVKGLKPVVLKSLSVNKLRQFSPRQIRSLTDEQKSVLTTTQKNAIRIK
jgi:hypothetical protein